MIRTVVTSIALCSANALSSRLATTVSTEPPFEAAFVGAKFPPDTRDVGNSGDYRILLNLVRPLIGFGGHAQFVGDALAKWSFNDAFTVFDFTLSSDLTFSNGEAVTAIDAMRTLERMMRIGKAIHYDFTNFESITVTGPKQFRIKLKRADRNLLEAMTAPEFAPLHQSDYSSSAPTFSITSGPYSISETSKGMLLLKKNPQYSGSSGPSSVRIRSVTSTELRTLDSTSIDFLPATRMNSETHRAFEKNGLLAHRLNLGYTRFAGLNADRPLLRDVSARRYLQRLLAPQEKDFTDYAPSVGSARQLYLPDGPGRVPEKTLVEIEKKILSAHAPAALKSGAPLNVLLGSNPLSRPLVVDKLVQAGLDVKVTVFKDWSHFAKLINEEKFDIVEAENDFSAIELLENLRVTFNPGRPLILLPKNNTILGEIEEAIRLEEPAKRYALFEKIGRTLLDEALIVPLYHSYSQVYLRKSYSAGAWNKSVPEMALWKLQKR